MSESVPCTVGACVRRRNGATASRRGDQRVVGDGDADDEDEDDDDEADDDDEDSVDARVYKNEGEIIPKHGIIL